MFCYLFKAKSIYVWLLNVIYLLFSWPPSQILETVGAHLSNTGRLLVFVGA